MASASGTTKTEPGEKGGKKSDGGSNNGKTESGGTVGEDTEETDATAEKSKSRMEILADQVVETIRRVREACEPIGPWGQGGVLDEDDDDDPQVTREGLVVGETVA